METQMHPEIIDSMAEHLDSFESSKKITLLLHSRGGDTSAGWSIANLIRSFCEDFEVIVPARAHSAATLLCLGANRIILTRQATLGPIDPSVNTPLNPQIPGGGPNARFGVSVESIQGFVELAKQEFGISSSSDMTSVLSSLASEVHPLVLGNVFRARSHIRMLANSLLEKQFGGRTEVDKIERIVSFLCSDSGSHDYTINRTEAREQLGLSVETPTKSLYDLIREVFQSIVSELEFRTPFNPPLMVASSNSVRYECRRAIIESLTGGTDVFVSEGTILKHQQPTPQGIVQQVQDNRSFEGWKKETHE
jgi:hypothetical protein